MLREADDFLAETEALHDAVSGLSDAELMMVTQFKDWTITDVLTHLHFWNKAADLSAQDPKAFSAIADHVLSAVKKGGSMRHVEDAEIAERGSDLRTVWIETARDMARRWRDMDPKQRLPWAGPSMSARSSITARQMETWAHGFEVFDALGRVRQDTDRIRNIVVLGVNTFGWAHQVHGLDVPETMPHLRLTAPSGEVWEYGDPSAGQITGSAVDFASVVTQTRALADTGLRIAGAVAETWMDHAQCFAGPPETPPTPGARRRSK